jgi:hypothetical protein
MTCRVALNSHLLLCTGGGCGWWLLLLLVVLNTLGCCCCDVYEPISHEGAFGVCGKRNSNINTPQHHKQQWKQSLCC